MITKKTFFPSELYKRASVIKWATIGDDKPETYLLDM
jgi:hypothetical protein